MLITVNQQIHMWYCGLFNSRSHARRNLVPVKPYSYRKMHLIALRDISVT